jgi:hypothetical protein
MGARFDFRAGEIGLSFCVVALPEKGFRGVGEAGGVMIVVGAFVTPPEAESEPVFGRDEPTATSAVQMPLADPQRVVAGGVEVIGQRPPGHMPQRLIVDDDAVRQRVSAREKRGAVGTAHGATADSVRKVEGLGGKGIGARCPGVWIAGKAESLAPPLVGKHEHDMRPWGA